MDILTFFQTIDQKLFIWLNSLHSPVIDYIMIKVSDFDLFAPFIGAFILFRLYRGDNRERLLWILGILAVVLSDAICARVLKPFFARPRPYLTIDGVHLWKGAKWLITTPDIRKHFSMNLSMPSCHATNMWTACFFMLWSRRIRYGLILIPIALIVSYSRIYLGVHYPFDCLAGMFLGCMLGFLMSRIPALYSQRMQAP